MMGLWVRQDLKASKAMMGLRVRLDHKVSKVMMVA
jgi:hypothetical protein